MLSRETILDDPEKVKGYIASKRTSNCFKEALATAYNHYVKINGLKWKKPTYVREENAVRVPTTENIERLIANATPKYATIISVARDTGGRPCELEGVKFKDVDTGEGIVYLPSRKGSKGRPKKLKPQTLVMLKRYMATGNYGLNDTIFPSAIAMRHGFIRLRNKLAEKLQDPTIRMIRLYDLRHYHGTITYLKTKDIVFTQRKMGHRSIKNTLKYIHLVNFKEDDWISRVARTLNEACHLIEAGFEYVTEMDGVKTSENANRLA